MPLKEKDSLQFVLTQGLAALQVMLYVHTFLTIGCMTSSPTNLVDRFETNTLGAAKVTIYRVCMLMRGIDKPEFKYSKS